MRRPIATIATVWCLLLVGCLFEGPEEPSAPGSSLAATNDLAKAAYLPTGNVSTADLDMMSKAGEAYYDNRQLHARLHNHLDDPLVSVTLRVVRKKIRVQVDTPLVRKLIAAPHSDFQVIVEVDRRARKSETWAWALVDATTGEDPR
jgi:hypothetical protein